MTRADGVSQHNIAVYGMLIGHKRFEQNISKHEDKKIWREKKKKQFRIKIFWFLLTLYSWKDKEIQIAKVREGQDRN